MERPSSLSGAVVALFEQEAPLRGSAESSGVISWSKTCQTATVANTRPATSACSLTDPRSHPRIEWLLALIKLVYTESVATSAPIRSHDQTRLASDRSPHCPARERFSL